MKAHVGTCCVRSWNFGGSSQSYVSNKTRGRSGNISRQLPHKQPTLDIRELPALRFLPAERQPRGRTLSKSLPRPVEELSRIQDVDAWVRDRMSRHTFHTTSGRQVGLPLSKVCFHYLIS